MCRDDALPGLKPASFYETLPFLSGAVQNLSVAKRSSEKLIRHSTDAEPSCSLMKSISSAMLGMPCCAPKVVTAKAPAAFAMRTASFVVRPRFPALVDGRPSTSQGTRYGATVPGGDRLPRSVLLGSAFSLMPRRARVRSLFPPRYEPSRCASCARIASDCLRVLLALVRVSVPLVDRTAPLRSARLSTSSQTRAHPCAGMARVTLARGSPPCAAGYAGQRRGVKAASPRLRRLWP